jgi:Thiolase C-terminal domain-like
LRDHVAEDLEGAAVDADQRREAVHVLDGAVVGGAVPRWSIKSGEISRMVCASVTRPKMLGALNAASMRAALRPSRYAAASSSMSLRPSGSGSETFPVNTDGGLIANGEPIGASGLRQMHELVRQLRGEAGDRQVPGTPRVGFAQVYGAPGTAAATILSA